jgi:hypothetical protein
MLTVESLLAASLDGANKLAKMLFAVSMTSFKMVVIHLLNDSLLA